MLNRIVLMGRLTRDPELRRTQSGTAVVSFSVACDRDYAAQGAERETDFIDIVAWRGTAEFVEKYFGKGRMIVVAGRLQIRNWEDRDGNKRRSAEVVADSVYFGDSKRDGDGGKAKRANRPMTRLAASLRLRAKKICRSKEVSHGNRKKILLDEAQGELYDLRHH